MVHNPEVAGSSPAGALQQMPMRRGAKAARRNVSNAQLRRDTNTHSTAGAEYMAKDGNVERVQIPPRPLTRIGRVLCPTLRRVSIKLAV